ncbi:MAG: hypothetical protein EXR66_00610 [Dehalococcoidia bacterium]|nr:hypothetical protein [Dehalococcoidia bacterium]
MTTDALILITEVYSAVLGVAAVLALAARVFLQPRIVEVDASLARIEAHLERINGSIGALTDWEHHHKLEHARQTETPPGAPPN